MVRKHVADQVEEAAMCDVDALVRWWQRVDCSARARPPAMQRDHHARLQRARLCTRAQRSMHYDACRVERHTIGILSENELGRSGNRDAAQRRRHAACK